MNKFPAICNPSYSGWNEDTIGFLCSYTSDWDMDDMAEYYISEGDLPLDYNFISLVIASSRYPDENLPRLKQRIHELNEELENQDQEQLSENVVISLIVNQIKRLYNIMYTKLPSIADMGIRGPLVLWSGRRRLVGLENLKPGSIWTSDKFISTSLSKDTALRFCNPQRPCILLKIVIPEDKLGDFPYTALLNHEITMPLDRTPVSEGTPVYLQENEFVVPLSIKLLLKGIKKLSNVTFDKPQLHGVTTHTIPTVTEYEFEYVSPLERPSKIDGDLKRFHGISGGSKKMIKKRQKNTKKNKKKKTKIKSKNRKSKN